MVDEGGRQENGGALRQADRQQGNEALWRDKLGQVAQYSPLAVTVNGPPLQVQGGLKHLQVMVLQDLAPCCIVLGPIWNLHRNNRCRHNATVLQSNTDRQTILSAAVSQALTRHSLFAKATNTD